MKIILITGALSGNVQPLLNLFRGMVPKVVRKPTVSILFNDLISTYETEISKTK